MSKFRINYSIDVKSIDKARLIEHKNGKTYLNMTMLIDPENPSQYGDHGFTTQQKDQNEPKELQLPIIGNAKIVWKEDQQAQHEQGMEQAQQAAAPTAHPELDDGSDIPF